MSFFKAYSTSSSIGIQMAAWCVKTAGIDNGLLNVFRKNFGGQSALIFSKITANPKNADATGNKSATFTASAVGDGLSYDWQYSTDSGSTWKSLSEKGVTATSASITIPAATAPSLNNAKIRMQPATI